MLFVFWALLAIGALAAAGYSHYRYRVRNNQYYQRLFGSKAEGVREREAGPPTHRPLRSYGIPAATLVMVCILVPMSLVI